MSLRLAAQVPGMLPCSLFTSCCICLILSLRIWLKGMGDEERAQAVLAS